MRLDRRLALLLGTAALAVTLAIAARAAAATQPPFIFKTQLAWTRTMTIVSTAADGLECRSQARLVAQSAAFYTARRRNPRYRHINFGTTPNSRTLYAAYNPQDVRIPGTATLEIGETRCNDNSVDPLCAGTLRARLELRTPAVGSSEETGQYSLGWAHRAPTPPTPMPPRPCLTGADPRASHSAAALSLLFTTRLRQHVPFPMKSLLTRRTVTTEDEHRDFHDLRFIGVEGTAQTRATFARVR
jgi:hypothetical protein